MLFSYEKKPFHFSICSLLLHELLHRLRAFHNILCFFDPLWHSHANFRVVYRELHLPFARGIQ